MNANAEHDARLRERLELLRKRFEEGKIFMTPEVASKLEASLLAVRADASGQIDLSTVDSSVRALALGMEHLEWRDQVKKTQSIRDVQELYFQFIHSEFSGMYGRIVEHRPDLSMSDAAKFLASDPERRDYVCKILPEFMESIRQFWRKAAADAITFHLQDFPGLKTVFGDDLFPVVEDSFISTSAIYTDTVVVPDPLLQTAHVFTSVDDHLKAYYFFKAALNLCSVARLALADVDPPIVCVLPSAHFWDEGQEAFIKFEMERAGLAHATFLFGREFATEQELWDFARGLDTIAKIKAALVHPERLLLNAGFEGTLEQKIENYLQHSVLPKRGMTPGLALAINSVGRMGQASDLLAKSRELGGVPMLEAPTSWHYLKWRLEYGADTSVSGERLVDEHVLRGLVGAPETECSWIGKLPDDALIELRTTGALSELRAKLGAGVGEIVALAPTDYQKSAHRVYGNIDQLLSEHAIALRELRGKKWTFAGTELSSSVVYGAVAFASAIGVPMISLVNTFIEQTEGTPKIADLAKRNRELREEAAKLKNSVVGVMFEARKKVVGD